MLTKAKECVLQWPRTTQRSTIRVWVPPHTCTVPWARLDSLPQRLRLVKNELVPKCRPSVLSRQPRDSVPQLQSTCHLGRCCHATTPPPSNAPRIRSEDRPRYKNYQLIHSVMLAGAKLQAFMWFKYINILQEQLCSLAVKTPLEGGEQH